MCYEADLLLVALVGLVALQRDLLRAGYLAHCLLLFRRRAELRTPGGAGGALFGRLVAFNFFVLLLEAAFQVGRQCAELEARGLHAAACPTCAHPSERGRLVGGLFVLKR